MEKATFTVTRGIRQKKRGGGEIKAERVGPFTSFYGAGFNNNWPADCGYIEIPYYFKPYEDVILYYVTSMFNDYNLELLVLCTFCVLYVL